MTPHVLYVGGEDHHLRIPFMRVVSASGFRVTAAGSGDPGPFRKAGIDFRPFRFDRFMNPRSDWTAIKSLAAMLRELRPNIAQSFDTKPNLLLPLAGRVVGHRGIVRTINGLAWIYSSRSPLALGGRPVYRALHRAAARMTAATVFQIKSDQAFFDRHRMAGRNSLVIPAAGAGVDVDEFERVLAQSPSPERLRDELGLGASEVVITVSRMTRQKGIATLLQAAALVHRVRPGVRFLLVGPRESEGPLAISQAEIDRHSPYVVATGPRSDVPALLNLADVFAFPTEYREGIPRVLLEAAVAHVPIVTTSMPGCCEVIANGWSGFVVPPHAPEVMAARILDFLSDRAKARTMAERAAALVRRDFNIETIVAQHTALYMQLLTKSSKGANQAIPDRVQAQSLPEAGGPVPLHRYQQIAPRPSTLPGNKSPLS